MNEPYVVRLRGWRKWGGVAAGAALTLAFVAFAIGGWLYGVQSAPVLAPAGLTGAALFAPMLVYYAALAQRYRVTLFDDSIEIATVFRKARMLKADVKGWTYGYNDGSWANVLLLHSRQGSGRPIEVPLASVDEAPVQSWFAGLTNLDDVAAAEDMEKLLDNARYGRTRAERGPTLVRERRLAAALNYVGVAAAIWIILWPRPYELAIAAGVAIPVAAAFPALALKNRWNLGFAAPSDQRPSLGGFYFLAPFALAFRVLDYDILDHAPLFPWGGASALCAVAACLFLRVAARARIEQTVLVLWITLYAFASAAHVNVQFDETPPQTFSAEVQDHRSDGRSYTLMLAPWGPRTQAHEVQARRALYDAAPPGSTVQVELHSGRLGARWFALRIPDGPPPQPKARAWP